MKMEPHGLTLIAILLGCSFIFGSCRNIGCCLELQEDEEDEEEQHLIYE